MRISHLLLLCHWLEALLRFILDPLLVEPRKSYSDVVAFYFIVVVIAI